MTLLVIPALVIGVPIYIIWRLTRRDKDNLANWEPTKLPKQRRSKRV